MSVAIENNKGTQYSLVFTEVSMVMSKPDIDYITDPRITARKAHLKITQNPDVLFYRQAKLSLLNTINSMSDSSLVHKYDFTFVVMQSNYTELTEAPTEDATVYPEWISKNPFTGKLDLLRSVVTLTKVFSGKCDARLLVATNNPTLNAMQGSYYVFDIVVHRGNPTGVAVQALMKSLGFRYGDSFQAAKSSFLNSLLWFGENRSQVLRESDPSLGRDSVQVSVDPETGRSYIRSKVLSNRKNIYSRSINRVHVKCKTHSDLLQV